jgi:nitrogen fixation-related uncharacterized protein
MKNGQNDDTYTPAVRILFDDELPIQSKKSDENQFLK